MKHLTSQEKINAVDWALNEVSRQLAAGELDQSGRYYSDAELAAGCAGDGLLREPVSSEKNVA